MRKKEPEGSFFIVLTQISKMAPGRIEEIKSYVIGILAVKQTEIKMKKHIEKIIYAVIVIITLIVFVFYFAACGNDITSSFGTVKTKSIELTDDEGETLAKVKAVKDASGKSVVNIMDKDGNVIGVFSGK